MIEATDIKVTKKDTDVLVIEVITDMPLMPWFDQYLVEEWLEYYMQVKIRRISWEDRKKDYHENWRIYWPSRDRFRELCQDEIQEGVLVVPDMINAPMNSFYGNRLGLTKNELLCMENVDCIDLTGIIYLLAKQGIEDQSDERWGDTYSNLVQKQVAESCFRVFASRHFRRKKVLITDCDGVLWPGIVAEDGINQVFDTEDNKYDRYRRFQKELLELVRNGILLCLCSKNERHTIMEALRDNNCELSEDYIAADSVCMQPKSKGVLDILSELNISSQEAVFLDDDKREVCEVQDHFPEMTCIQFDVNSIDNVLNNVFFLMPEDKENAMKRLHSYQDHVLRKRGIERASSVEEGLQALEIEIRVGTMEKNEVNRILELSHRTNKCTNGVRLTRTKLQKLCGERYTINTVYVSDKYGDLGLVGVYVVDKEKGCLEQFCLSCRALGLGVEKVLLEEIKSQGVTSILWTDTFSNSSFLAYCSSLFCVERLSLK